MSQKVIEAASRLGIGVDLQPAWLYLDARTLIAQFGTDRLEFFIPLRTLFDNNVVAGGGSDHMQKIGSRRSVNPYNPFLGMPQTKGFGNWNDVLYFVYVHIPARTVVVFQQRTDRLVPALKYSSFPGIPGIEIYS